MGGCHFQIIKGDAREIGKVSRSIDAIVTDPPYHLTPGKRAGGGFMGKSWDGGDVAFRPETWAEALRVIKPGGHLLAFGGTRTFHRLACAIEDGGWEIRDTLMYLYGTGYPKSLNISKSIDAAAGAVREVVGRRTDRAATPLKDMRGGRLINGVNGGIDCSAITAPATDAAKQWDGWGTALKPAWEPIILARAPLAGTVEQTVRAWGTGGLNVDACRIACEPIRTSRNIAMGSSGSAIYGTADKPGVFENNPLGRWPANLILDPEAAAALDEQSGELNSGSLDFAKHTENSSRQVYGGFPNPELRTGKFGGDSGGASRFFYTSKVTAGERHAGLPPGMLNDHPTVKPIDLCRWLCRLITPPGGTVLDPFCGSGSVGCAAMLEGFNYVGIDKDDEGGNYIEIAKPRVAHWRAQKGLFAHV